VDVDNLLGGLQLFNGWRFYSKFELGELWSTARSFGFFQCIQSLTYRKLVEIVNILVVHDTAASASAAPELRSTPLEAGPGRAIRGRN
jgi:hypothetical protein